MRLVLALFCAALVSALSLDAHSRQTTPKKTPPKTTRKSTPQTPLSKAQGEWQCPSELGVGLKTQRRFCDVLTGRDPKAGVLVTIPPHRGPVTMTFELHNRHTYSAELVKLKQAYRKYTATIGVLTLADTPNNLIERAVVQSEFRTEKDLFDRIGGGAGPGGMKAVAPSGAELISIELPENVGEKVSVLGERLTVMHPDGVDTFTAEGRPIATISNVFLEFRPGPAPKKKK